MTKQSMTASMLAPFRSVYEWAARSRQGEIALLIFITISVVLMSGCGTPRINGTALPPVKEYSKEFQAEMKKEMPLVREHAPHVNKFVQDQVKLRDKVRAGHKIIERRRGRLGIFRKK